MATPDWRALRAEFPTLNQWTYLDVARKTIPPRAQEQAVASYYKDVYEQAGDDAWAATNLAETRKALADLLGAHAAEIAFTKNTTEGLNIAAHGFDLKPGDNIVLTDMEHVANIWVWKHWEAKGVEIRYAKNRNGRLPIDAFLAAMDARTRVVSTAWVTYGNGYRVDLPRLGAICRERNARLVVDGVQGVGIIATRLDALGADIIAAGGHKGLLGLTGSGIVYCREELIDQLRTSFVKAPDSIASAKAHVNSQFDYMRTSHRFEGGNPNFLGVRVLRRGAELLKSIGIHNIESRVRALSQHCIELLDKAGLKTQTPAEWDERAHIVNVLVPDAAGVMDRLRSKHRIAVNVKDDAVRVSMSFFNNESDLEKAVDAIARESGARAAA
jgi:selenocysteine lyase/cysteine desulfurase